MKRKKRICIITCYKDPDYIRARTLRAALKGASGYETVVIKNTHRNLFRYVEVLWRVLWARARHHPDAYVLTFRGYELLLPIRLLSFGRPLVYDEFINPIEWAVYEHHKLKAGGFVERFARALYRFSMNSAQLILTDTESHTVFSAKLMGINKQKFLSLPVSTDERVFAPRKLHHKGKQAPFTVFYYGNMLPLHGLSVVIEAANILKSSGIVFRIVGGKQAMQKLIHEAIEDGAPIEYSPWLPFEQLPMEAARADICLGGPFGGTLQADMVTTGKTYQFLCMRKPTVIGQNQESTGFIDKKNVLIVRQRDAESLAETILWAQKNQSQLDAIGRSGRLLYEEKFSVEKIRAALVGRLDILINR